MKSQNLGLKWYKIVLTLSWDKRGERQKLNDRKFQSVTASSYVVGGNSFFFCDKTHIETFVEIQIVVSKAVVIAPLESWSQFFHDFFARKNKFEIKIESSTLTTTSLCLSHAHSDLITRSNLYSFFRFLVICAFCFVIKQLATRWHSRWGHTKVLGKAKCSCRSFVYLVPFLTAPTPRSTNRHFLLAKEIYRSLVYLACFGEKESGATSHKTRQPCKSSRIFVSIAHTRVYGHETNKRGIIPMKTYDHPESRQYGCVW